MCQNCPKYDDPQEAAAVAEDCRTNIKYAIEFVDLVSKACLDLEDDYRNIGLYYHTTEYEARATMAAMPLFSDELIHLEDYFQITEPAEYDNWASTLASVIEKASTLRSDMVHIPRQATPECLVHEYNQVICPALEDLKSILVSERDILKDLASEVNHLRTIEMNDEDRPRSWWYFKHNPETGKSELEHEGEEWNDFVNWVACLPETRKAMEQGEHVHDIVRRWIQREDGLSLTGLLLLDDGTIITEDFE
ncbi:hypothetical protein yc1106_02351 [Curvularia clavata]|uniref:Uncharacterized protein n=1 Tax=Curvularia clavata TaxID=95742 RepID=A0A9Q8Z3K4_CURCL|nr:hypothetical protein yc1106_02351 [Curvularia clavata]